MKQSRRNAIAAAQAESRTRTKPPVMSKYALKRAEQHAALRDAAHVD